MISLLVNVPTTHLVKQYAQADVVDEAKLYNQIVSQTK